MPPEECSSNDVPPTLVCVEELSRRGVPSIVAVTPVALVVANLSHGAVGAIEYQSDWPRLGVRYLDRLRSGGSILCVTDRRFPWAIEGEGGWSSRLDLGRHLRSLSARHPGRVRLSWTVGTFDVWEADLPLDEILAGDPDDAFSPVATASRRLSR